MMVPMWLLKIPFFQLSLSQTGFPGKLKRVLFCLAGYAVMVHSLRSGKQGQTKLNSGLHERTMMLMTLCFSVSDYCGFPKCRHVSQTSDQAPLFSPPLNTISVPGTQHRQHLGPRVVVSPPPALICSTQQRMPCSKCCALRGSLSPCASKGVIMLKEVLGVLPPSNVRCQEPAEEIATDSYWVSKLGGEDSFFFPKFERYFYGGDVSILSCLNWM